MARLTLLALALAGCSASGLSDYTVDPVQAEEGWRTSHRAYDLGYNEERNHTIEVPAGATRLDVYLDIDAGSVGAYLTDPNGETFSASVNDQNPSTTITHQHPAPGTWNLQLSSRGYSDGVVPSWELGGIDAWTPLVLVQRSFVDSTGVGLTIPGALGSLEAKVIGEDGLAQVSHRCPEADTCTLEFPSEDDYWVSGSAVGQGELTVTWRPAEILLDVALSEGSNNRPFTVPEGTKSIKVLGPNSQVRLLRGGFELCSGYGSCIVEQPVPGEWTVATQAYDDDVVRVGAIAAPENRPTVEDDHGNSRYQATHLEVGSLEAVLHAGDADWFDLTRLDTEGMVFSTLGTTDTFGTFYDLHGVELASDDDAGVGFNFRLEAGDLQPAYLAVTGFDARTEGTYTLLAGEADDTADSSGASAGSTLMINEVHAAPGADVNCDGVTDMVEDEFVEIVNVGTGPVDLTGMTLEDASTVRHIFEALTLFPSESIVVWGGGNPSCALPLTAFEALASEGGLGLNNQGDFVTLSRTDGTVVDAFAYEGTSNGVSWNRSSELDPTSTAVLHTDLISHPSSPGGRVDGSAF